MSGYTSKIEFRRVVEKFCGAVECTKHKSLNLNSNQSSKNSNSEMHGESWVGSRVFDVEESVSTMNFNGNHNCNENLVGGNFRTLARILCDDP